ncbi:hypothetical protein F444_01019, partial [Phytophthora nicotianae P1976]
MYHKIDMHMQSIARIANAMVSEHTPTGTSAIGTARTSSHTRVSVRGSIDVDDSAADRQKVDK